LDKCQYETFYIFEVMRYTYIAIVVISLLAYSCKEENDTTPAPTVVEDTTPQVVDVRDAAVGTYSNAIITGLDELGDETYSEKYPITVSKGIIDSTILVNVKNTIYKCSNVTDTGNGFVFAVDSGSSDTGTYTGFKAFDINGSQHSGTFELKNNGSAINGFAMAFANYYDGKLEGYTVVAGTK